MSERFAKTKVLLNVCSVLIAVAAALFAYRADHEASKASASQLRFERKQIALNSRQLSINQQEFKNSRAVLSLSVNVYAYSSSTGKELYEIEGDQRSPRTLPLGDWRSDILTVIERIANTGGASAIVQNFGLADRSGWTPLSPGLVRCTNGGGFTSRNCDDEETVRPGAVLFVRYDLTRQLISSIDNRDRSHNARVAFEQGAIGYRYVSLPISIPAVNILGY